MTDLPRTYDARPGTALSRLPAQDTQGLGHREILAEVLRPTMPETAARLLSVDYRDDIIPLRHALAAMSRVSRAAGPMVVSEGAIEAAFDILRVAGIKRDHVKDALTAALPHMGAGREAVAELVAAIEDVLPVVQITQNSPQWQRVEKAIRALKGEGS